MEDADFVVDKLKEIVAYLRSMSPLYEDFIKQLFSLTVTLRCTEIMFCMRFWFFIKKHGIVPAE